MPWENKLENFHLWELLWREGVILVNCEPQLHRMMSFQMKSPCRRVDIYQVSPFPTFLLSRVYQLVSKPFPCVCLCVIRKFQKESKMVVSVFQKFPYYCGFEQCRSWRSYAQVWFNTIHCISIIPQLFQPLHPNSQNTWLLLLLMVRHRKVHD